MSDREPATAREPASMLSFALDAPNLVSLAGLGSALLGVYFAIRGVLPAAMIGLVWAVVLDWTDGIVARRMPNRTAEQRSFGAQLDSLIDVVSFGVAPAIVLLAIGGFGAWFVPGAFLILAAAVIRLSHFNVFWLVGGSTYRGLALDNNVIVLAAVFALRPLVGAPLFVAIVYAVLAVLAVLNVAPIRTPKLAGGWYYAVIAFAVGMSAVFGWQLAAHLA